MLRHATIACVAFLLTLQNPVAGEPKFELLPVLASGDHSFNGSEIILDGGGQRLFLEIRISGWDPDLDGSFKLKEWQATIDSAGYTSGTRGTLAADVVACTVTADCFAAFGSGSTCWDPGAPAGQCPAGFIYKFNMEYVFLFMAELPAVDISTPDYRYASTLNAPTIVDPGVDKYAGTLILDVPGDVLGTFTIGFFDFPDSSMRDGSGTPVGPITFVPAVVTVLCQNNDDCSDGNACTDDVCENDGTCSNSTNHSSAFCCDPADRTLTRIDDFNACTDDSCDPSTGTVNNTPVTPGTVCGSGANTDCTDPDTCDVSGDCVDNHASAGAACGNHDDTDCTDPDTCDGNGGCESNHEDAGTPCGDDTDTDCDDPDTCNSTGTCLANRVPNGTPCNDGLYCNVNETCTTGACSGGGSRNCSDGIACTTDTCDETLDRCDNDLDPGFCLITGLCRTDGTTKPTNQCEECNTSLDTSDWSFKSVGTPCDDGLYCNVNEECAAGACGGGGPRDCDDAIPCTDDSCNEGGNTCVQSPNHSLCPDDGQFCNGDEICVVAVGCDHSGSPCGGPCDEEFDSCLCEAPIVEGVGGRFLRIFPQPPASGPQGIFIRADCPGAVGKYVNAPTPYDMDRDGSDDENVASLGDPEAVLEGFHTPAEWGELYVFGLDLVPDTTYIVWGDCGSPGTPGLSDPTVVTTPILGDTIGVFTDQWGEPDGHANISDVTAVLQLFSGLSIAPPLAQVDHMGTGPAGIQCLMSDLRIDIIDAVAVLQGFKGLGFEYAMGCPTPCP